MTISRPWCLFDVLVSGPALLLGAFGVGAAFGTRAGEGGQGAGEGVSHP